MIRVVSLHKAFGGRDLFTDAQLYVGARDRVALVGPNGSGKTTLLRMIAGEVAPERGSIEIASGVVIGYLRQDTDELRGRPVLQEVMSAGAEVTRSEHRLRVLEHEIAELDEGPERAGLLAEYGRLHDRFATLGGYTLESEARRILAGLGFSDAAVERPADTLSGGWLMRIALAKLLLSGPDVLMLDEPTNHLDLRSVEWLEGFLQGYDGSLLLISHDRDLINGIATKVVEVEGAKLISYAGDFEAFVQQREERVAQSLARAKNQARRIAETQAFIDRFRYKARKARQVQSRIKALEKMDRTETSTRTRRRMNVRFPEPARTGRVVVELSRVGFGYEPQRPVYEHLDFVLERGQKVALVGPNGAGKTTLLKLVAGVLTPQRGERKLGHNVRVGYFAQHQVESLDDRNTVQQELERALPNDAAVKPRDLLGRFLFSGDDVDKRVGVLSGGERNRLALAKMLSGRPNVLCLDEPTNHLDMQSRDVLEQALQEFPAAIVLITHDRHLIRAIADHIAEVSDGVVRVVAGDYDSVMQRSQAAAQPAMPETRTRPAPSAKQRRQRAAEERAKNKDIRDRVGRIEQQLDRAATEAARLATILGDRQSYANGLDIGAVARDHDRALKDVARLEAEWEEATAALERML